MLTRSENSSPVDVDQRLDPLDARTLPTALAHDLPRSHDARLKRIIEVAMRRSGSYGVAGKALLTTFTSNDYLDSEFGTALKMLDTSQFGTTPTSKLTAWLLGLAPLREGHRKAAARALTKLVSAPPSSLLMPAISLFGLTLFWSLILSIAFSLFALILGAIFGVRAFYPESIIVAGLLPTIPLFPVVLLGIHLGQLKSALELKYIAAHAVGRLGVVEAIPELAEASLERSSALSEMSGLSLHVLLPMLTPEHYGRLGPHVTRFLCRLLKRTPDFKLEEPLRETYAVNLVNALGKVGGPEAIEAVQAAANRWRGSSVVSAAERALALLEERKRNETARASLLRGAEQPVIEPGELLRASVETKDEKPELLLRPLDSD